MSRSRYIEDCDLEPWELIRWRGQVASAIRGKRGQKLLRELLAALEAMPDKRLISRELVDEDGEHCALGVVGAARGIDLETIDPEDSDQVAAAFDIAPCLAQEIVFENDEQWMGATPEERYAGMKTWVESMIKAPA